ncbi:MAG: DUF4293 domain-containing protein [Flavobacteriia bacterium]|jgi:hypothetical protein
MIQRIQSIYLAVAIILLSIVTTGARIASFMIDEGELKLTSFGLFLKMEGGDDYIADLSMPLYIVGILFVLLLVLTLMSYKKLKFQLSLAKLSFYVSLVLSGAVIATSFLFGSIAYGVGSYFIFITVPLTYLAMRGVKKDKSLIDSVDRIR